MSLKIGFLSKVDIHIDEVAALFAPEPVLNFQTRGELAAGIGDLDVLIAMNQGYTQFTIDAEMLAKADKLKLVQHHGVAADITDVDAAAARGIPVATVPGQNCRSVAEQAMFLMLGLAKRARTTQRLVEEGAMGDIVCSELSGRMLCLVGLGTIGKMLVPMARGFGMDVIGVRKDLSKDEGGIDGVERVFAVDALHTALAMADYTMLVLPLNRETINIIDGRAFAAMKDGAALVNLSRGGNVDRTALEAALEGGRLAGYATDVLWQEPHDPNDPLLKDERVFVTPHTGGKSIEAIQDTARAVYDNVMRLARGEKLQGVLNE